MPLQYQVPQFVDVEDRIFGPLTAKQFLMFVIAALIIAAIYVASPSLLPTVALAIPITIFTLLLAFYKVNGRSFLWFLYALAHYLFTGKRFLWERRGETPKIRVASVSAVETAAARRGSRRTSRQPPVETRIQELARILDTAGKTVEEDLPPPAGFNRP